MVGGKPGHGPGNLGFFGLIGKEISWRWAGWRGGEVSGLVEDIGTVFASLVGAGGWRRCSLSTICRERPQGSTFLPFAVGLNDPEMVTLLGGQLEIPANLGYPNFSPGI